MNNFGDVAHWRYRLWGRFTWLPEPLYYALGDLLVDLDGWRPLHMRNDPPRHWAA